MVSSYSKKAALGIICAFIGIATSSLHGYPVQAQRYVQKQSGTITKIVDLIYDVHVPLNDEHGHFDAGSEQLLSQLQTLAKQNNEVVGLFLETDGDEQLPPNIQVDFLSYLSYQISELHKKQKLNNLQFIPADTFRWHNNLTKIFRQCLEEIMHRNNPEWKSKPVIPNVRPFFEHFLSHTSLPEKELQALQDKLDKNTFTFLDTKWQKQKQDIEHFYDMYFKQIVEEQQEITFEAFFQEQLGDSKKRAQFITKLDKAVNLITDFELLLKLFTSTQQHCIIYVGAYHCSKLADILVQQFNFKQMVNNALFDFHAHCDKRDVMKQIKPLPPQAFNFLTKKPEALQAKPQKQQKQKLIGITKKRHRKK